MKNVYKKLALIGIALMMLVGNIPNRADAVIVFAATENTVIIGDNAPMTRDEFMDWSNLRGIRHFNIEGRVYPAGIFFGWANGQAFNYGELIDGILHITLHSAAISGSRSISVLPDANEMPQDNGTSPLIFTDSTPILLSDDELTAIIENVPHQTPLDTRSCITLPNRRLSDSELEAWVHEYNEMGGATAFELEVVREINRVRVQHGLRSLALDPSLMMSARLKTQEFGDLQYFAHRSPVHGSVTASAFMFGFEGRRAAETITQTGSNGSPEFRTNAERIVGGMLASTRGHREILLNPNAYSVGFGAFFSPNSTGRNGNMTHMFYYSAKFGFFE